MGYVDCSVRSSSAKKDNILPMLVILIERRERHHSKGASNNAEGAQNDLREIAGTRLVSRLGRRIQGCSWFESASLDNNLPRLASL